MLTAEQIDVVNVIAVAVSALSCMGSGFIIVCYFCYGHLRKFAFKLVCLLSICDFGFQISAFLIPKTNDILRMREGGHKTTLCLVQASMQSFFELSSVLWTTTIAITLYATLIRRTPVEALEKRFYVFVLFCFGLPAVLTAVPGAMGAYGDAGAWCWIEDKYNYWRFVQFYGPLWAAIIFNGYVYYVVTSTVARSLHAAGSDNVTASQAKQIINRLRFYPLILVIVWGFATINRAVEWANHDEEVFWLFCVQKFFSSMQGFLNAFAYGFSSGVREALRLSLSEICPCVDPPYQVQQLMSRPGLGSPLVQNSTSPKPIRTHKLSLGNGREYGYMERGPGSGANSSSGMLSPRSDATPNTLVPAFETSLTGIYGLQQHTSNGTLNDNELSDDVSLSLNDLESQGHMPYESRPIRVARLQQPDTAPPKPSQAYSLNSVE